MSLRAILSAVLKERMLSVRKKTNVPEVRHGCCFLLCCCLAAFCLGARAGSRSSTKYSTPVKPMVEKYCVACHDEQLKKGGLDLEKLSASEIPEHADEWERVIRKLRARQRPDR